MARILDVQRMMQTTSGPKQSRNSHPNFSNTILNQLRGIGSRASEAVLWQTLNQFYDKGRSFKDLFSAATFSPTLIVYCDIISGHTHKQLSCTKPLPQGISLCNMRNLHEQNLNVYLTPFAVSYELSPQ